ncbi:MAG: hypothetical protein M3P41_06810, partial [Actinomycetota bacterium]|nr:hypothetical protein [Actinomycetota bacterium]
MSAERRDLQSLSPREDDVVPIAESARSAAFAANGDRPEAHAGVGPRPARLTAADFTPERMLRPTAQPPADGWRRTLYLLSGGVVAIPPSV